MAVAIAVAIYIFIYIYIYILHSRRVRPGRAWHDLVSWKQFVFFSVMQTRRKLRTAPWKRPQSQRRHDGSKVAHGSKGAELGNDLGVEEADEFGGVEEAEEVPEPISYIVVDGWLPCRGAFRAEYTPPTPANKRGAETSCRSSA